MFTLHPKLEQDSLLLGHLPLCQLRLMNNASFPWLLLIPAKNDVRELTELSEEQSIRLMAEIRQAMGVLEHIYQPDKLNVGALGNQVPQLHVHVIARFRSDDAWPEPVWGKGGKPYSATGREEALHILVREFKKMETFREVSA